MTPSSIENILRNPPTTKPPTDLLSDLERQIVLPKTSSQAAVAPIWKRWFPALSFGLLILGCLMALGIQTHQLIQLQRENESLRQATRAISTPSVVGQAGISDQDENEIRALRAEVEQLRQEAQATTELRALQDQLQTQVKAAVAKQGEEDPFAAHKAKAESIACINNLKQIGLAARIWANTHGDVLPPDFMTMRNELNTPKSLICPGDTTKLPVTPGWEQFNPGQITYEYPGAGAPETDPYVVLARCPIHGNIGLVDGSAMMNYGTNLNLVTEAGRLKLFRNATINSKP